MSNEFINDFNSLLSAAKEIGMTLEISICTDWSGSIRDIHGLSNHYLGHLYDPDSLLEELATAIRKREHRDEVTGNVLSRLFGKKK